MNNPIYIIFRNDDPCARSNPKRERQILELFERYAVPQVLAVVPHNISDPHVYHSGETLSLTENPAIIELLKEYHAKGLVEIAQHGYTHQTSRFRPSKEEVLTDAEYYQGIDRKWTAYKPSDAGDYSEFNGLPVEEQREKVVKGQEYLEGIFGFKLQSFIFPWNAYNPQVLRILKERGFKFVPVEDDEMYIPGLCLIGSCNWDWQIEQFSALLDSVQGLDRPVLTQFAYHSWEVSDAFLEKLEALFKKIKAMPNVKCIRPCDIPAQVPWAPEMIRLRGRMMRLGRRMEKYLNYEPEFPRYYVNDPVYYWQRIFKYAAGWAVLEKFGLRRCRQLVLLLAAAFAGFLGGRALLGGNGVLDAGLGILLAGLAAGYIVLRFRLGGPSPRAEKMKRAVKKAVGGYGRKSEQTVSGGHGV